MTEPREPRYRVVESDRAEADRDALYLSLLSRFGPEHADSWHRGLLDEIRKLTEFPGPLAHPIIHPATSDRPEIRRLLYYGQAGRRSRTSIRYRVLFHIIVPEHPDDETVIRILRILHSAQSEEDTTNNDS